MSYPDGMTTAALDAHNGRDDDPRAEADAICREARALLNTAWDRLNSWADVRHPATADAIGRAMELVEKACIVMNVEDVT